MQQALYYVCYFLGMVNTLQRQNAENLKQIFPAKEYRGFSLNFHIRFVCERIIYTHDESAFSAGGNMYNDPGNI